MKRAFLFSAVVTAVIAAVACSSSESSGTGSSSASSSANASSSASGSGSTSGSGGATGDPTPAESCVKAGEHGNSRGVGEYCTPGGGECKAFADAGIGTCLADFGQDQWFCSRIFCTTNDQCGEDAVCYKDPQGSACLPSRCAPEQGDGGADGGDGGA